MPTHIVSNCADNLQVWTRSKKKLTIEDMRLPWLAIYKILSKDLFLTRRQYEIRCADFSTGKSSHTTKLKLLCVPSQTSWYMGFIAEHTRRFFHPAAIDEMLATFVPLVDGTDLSVSFSEYVFSPYR